MSAKNINAIFKKELRSYFTSPVGYVVIIFYLLVSNGFFFFIQDFFRAGQASMRSYFGTLPWIFLFVPAITMRLWAEERKVGTLEILLTLPLREVEVVLGKFLASFVFLAITLAFTLTLPISIGFLGRPDFGVIIGSYFGALFLGAAYLSIGILISSLTENQIVAFIISVVGIFLLLAIGALPVYLNSLGPIVHVFDYLSLLTHFNNINRGIIDSRDVVYYVSVVVFFLYLNVKNIESRKWR